MTVPGGRVAPFMHGDNRETDLVTAPESNPPSGDALQFDRVEPADTAAVATGPQCAGCRQSITSHYYEINGQTICENCRAGVLSVFTGGSRGARFFKALFLGMLAAIVSAGVWVAIIKATGYELALVAIFVGIFVGAAVRKGSNARGGWLYQSMAVLLTYLAITGSYVPLLLEDFNKQSIAETQALVASEAERSVISIGADGDVFGKIAIASFVAAVVLAALTPFIKKWMHQDDEVSLAK